MKVKFKIKEGKYFKLSESNVWEDSTEEELKAAGEDAELIDDNAIDCNVKFSNGDVLERVDLQDGKLMFKFVDKDVETFEDSKADAYYYGIQGLLRSNKDDKIEEIYNYCFDKNVGESTKVNEADDNPFGEDTPDEDRNPEGDNTEPDTSEDDPDQEEIHLDTVDDVNTYISDEKNPLDKTYTDLISELSDEKTIGGQTFNIGSKTLPLKEGSKTYCRVLVGALADNPAATFTVFPDNWQSIAEVEEVNLDDANSDISCNVTLSEDLVLDNADDFYKEIGEVYTEVSPYSAEPEQEPDEGTNDNSEPTEDNGEPAEMTGLTEPDANPFESTEVVKYKTSVNEAWLNNFSITDNFSKLVEEFKERFKKFTRKSISDRVNMVMAESGKFLAVRVDKAGILNDTISSEKFKKRLSHTCESIKKYSKGLRIVETRGSYYTRTFFLVEAIESNYCISESAELPEIQILNDKTILESKETKLSEDLMNFLNTKIDNPDSYVVRPVVKTRSGITAESYKVNNDGKVPFVVKLNECDPQIVFIPVELAPALQAIEDQVDNVQPTEPVQVTVTNPDVQPTEPVQEPVEPTTEITQSADIAPKQEPIQPTEPEKKIIHMNQLFSDGWGGLVDEVCAGCKVQEDDISGGLTADVFPVQVYDNNDLPACKVLVVDVYGNRYCVDKTSSVYGDNYIIKDMYGQPTSSGTNCDNFLKKLAAKYIG